MKRKDIAQLATATVNELEARLKESRTKLHDLRLGQAVGKLKNPHEITMLRRDIARTLTFMNQKKNS